jgi:TQXA domain-containing protein/LPXTG-motif cell wall-anchored protein
MFNTHRRRTARLAAAGLTAGLLAAGALAGAGTALADDATPSAGGATAVLQGLEDGKFGNAIVDGDTGHPVPAGLFTMTVPGGGAIETYCIDFQHHTANHASYTEVGWDNSTLRGNPNAGKVAWILNNSYPKVDAAALSAKLSADGVNLSQPLTDAEAAEGTQVAIWHFSDPTVKVQAADADAKALSDYLNSHAVTLAEPKPAVTLDPPAVSGKSGDRIGPITVHATSGSVDVTLGAGVPAGVKIVDKDGQAVTTAKDGSQLYFDVPAGTADGSTSVTVSATTEIAIGRAFSATDQSSQSQILAGSDSTTVTAAATLSWARKGPIPALSAQIACAKGGVDVTATNKGDEDFTFKLVGKDYTVAPGKSQTITVPVGEDQKYKIDITLPNGSVKTFQGVVDCKTAAPAPSTPANQPSPASGSTGGTSLAETGSSNATPVIAGIAVALVVIGGGAAFFFRRKKNTAPSE